MTVPLRLLIDPPLDGPANMARDEALLDAVGAPRCPATLRFYRWSEPTISLGYFQPYADLESVRGQGRFDVVRRTTGGGAILHDRELTYALVVPQAHPLLDHGPTNVYCLMHDAIVGVLQDLGVAARRRRCESKVEHHGRDRDTTHNRSADEAEPFFCFARAHALDIVVGGSKLAGSAQRRTSGGVLQHGSIILEALHDQQPSAAVGDACRVDADELARRIAGRFADDNDLALRSSQWQPAELDRANHHVTRYNSPPWTRRR